MFSYVYSQYDMTYIFVVYIADPDDRCRSVLDYDSDANIHFEEKISLFLLIHLL